MGIDKWINLLAVITLIEMMVAIGLCTTAAQIIEAAGNWKLLLGAALANYIIVPLATVGLLFLFQAPPMISAGFLIVAVCPGAPFGPPLTALARGNVSLSVGLMVLLAASSGILAPLLLAILIPMVTGEDSARIHPLGLIALLMGSQLLPLFAGLALAKLRPVLAEWLKKPLTKLSTLLNLATFGLILTVQFRILVEIRLAAHLGMLALLMSGILAGWLVGGPGRSNRTAMMMATAVRNAGVAVVIATSHFPGTPVVTAATAFALFQILVMTLVAWACGRISPAPKPAPVQLN
jgi:BASS family bile acid:Na+ symporter